MTTWIALLAGSTSGAPARLAAIDAAAVAPDRFEAGDRVIHAWYKGGPFGQAVTSCYPWPIAAVAMLPCGRPLLELTVRLQ